MDSETIDMQNENWCQPWFDSTYYPILYKHRNYQEAADFIEKITTYLKLPANANVWDMACGNGRHALTLNKLGYRVVATDIAEKTLERASEESSDGILFRLHDMREPFEENCFDAVFNLFTSLGYFSDFSDNEKVFNNATSSLKSNGYFVLDFFNASMVKKNIIPYEVKSINDLEFHIKKGIIDNYVVKTIEVIDQGKSRRFMEKVHLFNNDVLIELAEKSGLKLYKQFGSYQLEPFVEEKSDRLILIFQKP